MEGLEEQRARAREDAKRSELARQQLEQEIKVRALRALQGGYSVVVRTAQSSLGCCSKGSGLHMRHSPSTAVSMWLRCSSHGM